MIHLDISGPLNPSMTSITTMYNDYSKVDHVVALADQRWTLVYVQEYVAKIKRQLSVKVRFL